MITAIPQKLDNDLTNAVGVCVRHGVTRILIYEPIIVSVQDATDMMNFASVNVAGSGDALPWWP
jgi:hypothetical protein